MFLERHGTVGIGLIAPSPKLVSAVGGKAHLQVPEDG
jgi:hypothetical protein